MHVYVYIYIYIYVSRRLDGSLQRGRVARALDCEVERCAHRSVWVRSLSKKNREKGDRKHNTNIAEIGYFAARTQAV